MSMGGTTKFNKKLFDSVLRRLSAAGVSRAFLRSYVLPDWWDDDLLATPSGSEMGLMYISSFFNISLGKLIEETDLRKQGAMAVSYKKRASSSENSLEKATLLGLWTARLVAAACITPFTPLPSDGNKVYTSLSGAGNQGVGLQELTEFAWTHGIPVVRITPPRTGNHPDGLCTVVDGRPVIILMKRHNSSAWQVFILAHELGHAALGHVFSADDATMVDKTAAFTSGETQEKAASVWACAALSGNPCMDMSSVWTKRPSTGKDLSILAFRYARTQGIDPGFLILNYVKGAGDFRMGNAALLNLDDQNAFQVLDDAFRSHIKEDSLSEENWDLLKRLQS